MSNHTFGRLRDRLTVCAVAGLLAVLLVWCGLESAPWMVSASARGVASADEPVTNSPANSEGSGPTASTAKANGTDAAVTAVPVTVAQVEVAPVENWIRVVGTLEGFEEIEVGPLVEGRIARILHDVGDLVAPGDSLLEIDDADARLAVTELTRGLELELARLGLKVPPAEDFDLTTLPAVVKAGLQEANKRKSLDRMRSLADKKVVSQDELERADTDHQVAVIEREEQLLAARQTLAAVRQRQAMLATAEKRLADTQVRVPDLTQVFLALAAGARKNKLAAPTDPAAVTKEAVEPVVPVLTVAERMVSEGEIVLASPPSMLFKLVIEDPLKLRASVPERYAAELKVGQTVEITVEAFAEREFPGVVSRVNPTIDRASRTLQIEVAVPNADRQLKVGSFTTALVQTGVEEHALWVPEQSVLKFAGVVKVFIVRDGAAVGVPVEILARKLKGTGEQEVPWVVVEGDLKPGESVVVTGHSQLANGTLVRVRTP